MAKGKTLKRIGVFLVVILAIILIREVVSGGIDLTSTAIGDYINEKYKNEILEKVPEEFRSNYYFRWFGLGDCEYMTGDTMVTIVFVDDEISTWGDVDKATFKTNAEKVFSQLESDAKSYGATLSISTRYLTAKSTGNLSLKDYMPWVNSAISSAGLPSYNKMGVELEKKYDVDNAPVIFCANRDGRCFAKPANVDRRSEFAIIYEDTNSLYHEFCHIFGADDFYYPESVKDLAATHLPESIMGSNGKKMDSFTAFLIGWTDTLDKNATTFLEKTNYLTDEYMKTQYADETYTGYVENKLIGDTYYTGNLVDGILEGQGKKIRDGAIWEGTFKGGLLDGEGRFKSAEGNTYVGDFISGKCHGTGTYTWANGDSYTGSFVKGVREGKGTFKWAHGTVYTGDFAEGKRTGKGTCRWTNGDTYTGDFVDGARSGKGTYTWANGDTYTGDFLEGKLNGYGTLTYASGRVRKGKWSNGKFVG